eukprot:5276304-Amphidinium_carterae.3
MFHNTLVFTKLKGRFRSWHPSWSNRGGSAGSAGNRTLGCSSGRSQSCGPASLQKWYTFIAKFSQVSQIRSGLGAHAGQCFSWQAD